MKKGNVKALLTATTTLGATANMSHAQATEKATVAAPVPDPAAKADPDLAKVLAALQR